MVLKERGQGLGLFFYESRKLRNYNVLGGTTDKSGIISPLL